MEHPYCCSGVFDHHPSCLSSLVASTCQSPYQMHQKKKSSIQCFNFWGLMVLRGVQIHWILSAEYGNRILPNKSMYAWLNWWRILEYPSIRLTTWTVSKSMHQLSTAVGWLSTKCGLVIVLPLKSSATQVTSVKFVQGGFQNNPQNETGATVWALGQYHKEGDVFFSCMLLVAKYSSTTASQTADVRIWDRNT
jgi:hypothetical protein